MDGQQLTATKPQRTEGTRWNRREAATCQRTAERLQRCGSERAAAQCVGVPRSTLRNWSRRQRQMDLPAAVVEFFESPDGLDVLHGILVAAHLVFCEAGPCGTRRLCQFLQLSGLDDFVAASYGSQHKFGNELQRALVEFGEQEHARLAPQMSPREITLCQDETFHPQTCLVAIEPLSDFILVEGYTDQLDSQTWTTLTHQALQDLPVKVVQSTSDEGRSLIKHCRVGLGAHHSPDIFHIQRDVSQAFSGKTNGAVQHEATKLRHAEHETARLEAERDAVGPTHTALFDTQIRLSQAEEQAATEQWEAAKAQRQEVRDAIRGISDDYHPVDLQTGAPREASDIAQVLEQRFDNVERLADQYAVSQSGRQLIAKARKNIGQLVATIAFFWQMFAIKTAALKLPDELSVSLTSTLLPASYLEYASRRAATAEERRRLRTLSEACLARAREGPFGQLDVKHQEAIERVVRDCAGLFQRSSSCVEGRNSQLALHHHGLHRLSGRKLTALTTLHNFFIQRPDGTTAAQRFFGRAPRNLFEWLLNRLPLPARPRHCPV
jgi:hypothetical protein